MNREEQQRHSYKPRKKITSRPEALKNERLNSGYNNTMDTEKT